MSERQNKIIGVVGRKGSGKSTIADHIVRQSRRALWFDTMGEHPMVDRIEDLDELQAYLEEVRDPKEKFQASYVPHGDIMEDFHQVCPMVYETGNITFGVEEVPMLTKSAAWVDPRFSEIIRLGRHQVINLVWTAQRMSEVPRSLTSATDLFILFCHTEPGDIKAIGDRCNPEIASCVQSLGLHGFIGYDVVNQNLLDEDETIEIEPWVASSSAEQQKSKKLWEGVNHGGSIQ